MWDMMFFCSSCVLVISVLAVKVLQPLGVGGCKYMRPPNCSIPWIPRSRTVAAPGLRNTQPSPEFQPPATLRKPKPMVSHALHPPTNLRSARLGTWEAWWSSSLGSGAACRSSVSGQCRPSLVASRDHSQAPGQLSTSPIREPSTSTFLRVD